MRPLNLVGAAAASVSLALATKTNGAAIAYVQAGPKR